MPSHRGLAVPAQILTGLALSREKSFPAEPVNSSVKTYAFPDVSVTLAVPAQFDSTVNVPVSEIGLEPVPEATVALIAMALVPLIVMVPSILKTVEIVVDVNKNPEPLKAYVPAGILLGQVVGSNDPLPLSEYDAS